MSVQGKISSKSSHFALKRIYKQQHGLIYREQGGVCSVSAPGVRANKTAIKLWRKTFVVYEKTKLHSMLSAVGKHGFKCTKEYM